MSFLQQAYKFLHPKYQKVFLEYKVDTRPRYGHGLPPHQRLYDIIQAHRSEYEKILTKALSLQESIWSIRDAAAEKDNLLPVWNNGWLPGLDIVALYTLIAHYQPKQYIEIGSGNSTKVAKKAIRDQQLHTVITSIDPMPRVEIDALSDHIVRLPLEKTDLSVFDTLHENDILFVDNSHRILPNSDATVVFMEILPRLKKGVIVQVHDVYLPYDYPQDMCDRFYSEQYGLAFYLLANSQTYQPLLPNYFIAEDPALSKMIAPIWDHENLNGVERHGGSFWIRIH